MIVYTCITNNKDQMPKVERYEGVRYVCFSDQYFYHPVWEYLPAYNHGQNDPRRVARRYKWLSHIYFPNQDTIWIDGRVSFNTSPLDIYDKYDGNIVIRPHGSRDCIYQEAAQIKKIGYEIESVLTEHLEYIKAYQYPVRNGLHETGIMLRRWSNDMIAFNLHVWSLISQFSKRDQLSADFVSWLYNIPIQNMDTSEVSVGNHRIRTNHLR